MFENFLPPTDNLYKFMAVSGLIILGLAFVPVYLQFHLAERKIEYGKQLSVYDLQLDGFTATLQNDVAKEIEIGQQLDNLSEFVKNSQKKVDDRKKQATALGIKNLNFKKDIQSVMDQVNVSTVNIQRLQSELLPIRKQEEEQREACAVKRIDLGSTNESIELNELAIRVLMIVAAFFFILGGSLAISGFRLWHSRLQLPSDSLLAYQIKKKRTPPRLTK